VVAEKVMNSKKFSIVPWALAQLMAPMGVMPRGLLTLQMGFLYDKVGTKGHGGGGHGATGRGRGMRMIRRTRRRMGVMVVMMLITVVTKYSRDAMSDKNDDK
jgi:hypothetical protein